LGEGWMQVISDFDDVEDEFAMLRRLVAVSQRPMAITILQRDNKPEEWRRLCGWIAEANAAGLPMLGQVLTRPTGILLGFEISQNPFVNRPSYQKIAALPFAERIAILRQPAFRAELLAETDGSAGMARRVAKWDRIFPLGDPPDYEPAQDTSVAAMAARQGRDPSDVAYDLLLERDGKAILYRPLSNYSYGNLDTVHDMLNHDATIVGLGDGGAHVGVLCDSSAISYMLTHWTRDRTRGEKFALPWAIRRLTRDSAAAIGLCDRGVIARGYKADINVIDYDRLRLRPPEVVYDLPSGGRRLVQRADGYVATIVSGVPVYRDGEATGALPGRLVRGAQAAPG
jgi:N-acyl-D-aspartate/D-glutamate deacylase